MYTLTISMWPTANTFLAGHRVRLQVSSGAHPLFARNTGTGEPLATGTRLQVADQEVFHDSARPSHIELPVVRLLGDTETAARRPWHRRPSHRDPTGRSGPSGVLG